MEESVKYWLALSRIKGLEKLGLQGVLDRFGSPEAVFREKTASLEALSPEFAAAARGFDGWEWVDKELGLIERLKVRLLTFDDPAYPPLLKRIYAPPCLLYLKGGETDLSLPAVAVIGTRRPTHYGLKMAETLGQDLASSGLVVVSGMARGCDAAAHRGALRAKGRTVAVLGTGVDIAYPKEGRDLYEEISAKGLLVSEYAISTPPVPQNFPRRNRIISGLSIGVIVVEAPLRSGSLMTARLALEAGREVFAVPGQATSAKSSGANKLIRDGATLTETARDVLEALSIPFVKGGEEAATPRPALEGEEKAVWKALDGEPLHIDSIIERTGLSATKAASLLLGMEIKGLIEQLPGKCFLKRL